MSETEYSILATFLKLLICISNCNSVSREEKKKGLGCKVECPAKRRVKESLKKKKKKSFDEEKENAPSSPSFQFVQQSKTTRFVLLWSPCLCVFLNN